MFELPEMITLARQINEDLQGKMVKKSGLGNSPHKFVWHNRTPDEFASLTAGKTVGEAYVKGRWMFVRLEPGYVLVFGECGGKLLRHQPGDQWPAKYHLDITFDDGSSLTATTQMWGAYELYEQGMELEREYIKDMRPTPVKPEFSLEYFNSLIDEITAGKKQSVKGLLTQDQMIPGLGNSVAQDIMFNAGLHPRHSISELTTGERETLYKAIIDTVQRVIDAGGRYDETDLHGEPGGYVRLMDKESINRPCPRCGGEIVKIQYLGGACYLCPTCQL
jgi:formamidopyrimidine-DNA glycosylase